MEMSILTPSDHHHWDWFVTELADQMEIMDSCNCTHRLSRKILEQMGQDPSFNVDVEQTLGWFKMMGGFCDCEILLGIGLSEGLWKHVPRRH